MCASRLRVGAVIVLRHSTLVFLQRSTLLLKVDGVVVYLGDPATWVLLFTCGVNYVLRGGEEATKRKKKNGKGK